MTAVIVLLCLAGLLAFLLLVAVVRALRMRHTAPPAAAPPPNPDAAARYAEHLGRMIRCETLSAPDIDPATTRPAFAQLREVLQECYPRVFAQLEEIAIEEATLLRWAGRDAARPAMLLLAHSDVVPATGAWQRSPFSGQVQDGKIWGRGAMDTKNTLCAMLEAAEALLAEGFVPACDVYFASSHNEEKMGPGAVRVRDWLVANGVQLALVLDEGGCVTQNPLPGLGDGWFAMVGLVEKGYANVRFTARSAGGHASTPPQNSPLARLAAFAAQVEKHPPFPTAMPPVVRDMLAVLAPYMEFRYRLLFGNLWLFAPLAKRVLCRFGPQAAALLRTTCAFTMAAGSAAPNVLPETATLTANLRFIMHQGMDASLAAIEEVATRYGLEMEVLYANDIFPTADTESPAYRFAKATVEKAFPEAAPCPYIMVAGTDARHFAPLCNCTLRFSPAILSAQQRASMHGLNENSDVASLARGVHFYTLLLRDYV
ncbi:M20/M25/M40 family metallo-hydrolase [Ruminococcaceae bacterium OttesenSCG-928-O06]|nr:M20/M25/M40 family metallo-hydrolase [Ruminococcaceae bacterium OttesenSCG-928-O06]